MASRLPDFLIAGAAKCGTTSLSAYLAEHPEVFVAADKELHFFDRDEIWQRGVGWYGEQFAAAADARAAGEATPGYMFDPSAVARIAEVLPDVRVIVCLRDPVERAHSHYLHWRDDLAIERRSFAAAMEAELAAGGREVAPYRLDARAPYFAYLARGRYLPQLERLAAVFGRERLHVVLLEDLVADPRLAFAGVCRFIGVDPAFAPPNVGRRVRAYQRHRPAWLYRTLVRRRIFHRMPQRLAQFTAELMLAPESRLAGPIDPALHARLAESFRADNVALGAWLDRDLSHWGAQR